MLKPTELILGYPLLRIETLLENAGQSDDLVMRMQDDYIIPGLTGGKKTADDLADELNLLTHVRADMPPVFLWHTGTDDVTSGRESTEMIAQLMDAGVPCEFHLFAEGRHGMALCDETSAGSEADINDSCAAWVTLAQRWMENIGSNENR